MKKLFLALLVIAFAVPACFAAQATKSTKPCTAATVEKSMTGKVDSVILEDQTKGIKSEIVIVDHKGAKHNFIVTAATVIKDKEAKDITLDKITKGEKVHIKYVTKETVKEALAINVVQ